MLKRGRSVAQLIESGESGTRKAVIFDKFDCSVKLCTLCLASCLNPFMSKFRKWLSNKTIPVRRTGKGEMTMKKMLRIALSVFAFGLFTASIT
ncbi:MAG: hypothetical protein AAB401_24985, partial [Acidobacteriota bacterium]